MMAATQESPSAAPSELAGPDRRSAPRRSTDFYAVELRGESRYFRLVLNVSASGLLFENRLADEKPGQVLELVLPRTGSAEPLKVRAEVVYVTDAGHVGVRVLDASGPADDVGGKLLL